MRIVVVLGLLACSGRDAPPPEETNSDADTDSDSDTDTDSGSLTFSLPGEAVGSWLSLTWARVDGDDITLGGELSSTLVTSDPAVVPVGAPTPEDLVAIDPALWPGLLGAWYLPSLHLEGDDGERTYTALGRAWPVYLAGELPRSWLDAGWGAGWNAMDTGDASVVPTSDIPLVDDLATVADVSIAGTYGGEADLADLRLALLPGPLWSEGTVAQLLVDAALTTPWTLPLTGRPPDDHFTDLGDGVLAALEVPLSYADSDGSGSYGEGDVVETFACIGPSLLTLLYLDPPTDLLTAFGMAWASLTPGWNILQDDGAGGYIVLDQGAAQSVALDAGCQLN